MPAPKGWTKVSVANRNVKRLDKIIEASGGAISSYNQVVETLISEHYQKPPQNSL